MIYKRLILLLTLLALWTKSQAQELNCVFTVDKSQAPDFQQPILDDLKNGIQNFFNNKRWTNDRFNPEERIKINILYTLAKESAIGVYIGSAQIQIVRPVYGTTYESVILMHIDKDFNFEYIQGQPIDFNENTYINGLSSLLTFYGFIALGVDYDTFSKLGGSAFIEKARNVATIAVDAGGGWKQGDFRNRWGLIDNLFNQQMLPFREGLYTYHLEGLDKFVQNPDEARAKILDYFKKLKAVNQLIPLNVLIRDFFQAKRDQEIIPMFAQAKPEMKSIVVPLLKELDATNAQKYDAIMKGQ